MEYENVCTSTIYEKISNKIYIYQYFNYKTTFNFFKIILYFLKERVYCIRLYQYFCFYINIFKILLLTKTIIAEIYEDKICQIDE